MGNVNNRTLSITVSLMMLVIAFSPFITTAYPVPQNKEIPNGAFEALAMLEDVPSSDPAQVGSRGPDPFIDAYTYDLGFGSIEWDSLYTDLDGDGDKDLVLWTHDGSFVEYCNLTAIDVAEGRFLWNFSSSSCSGASVGALDSDGDGIQEVWMQEHDVYHILHGNNGTEIWKTTLCDGPGVPCTPAYGDVDGDNATEVVLTSVENPTTERARAFNMTSGAIDWVAPDFGYGEATAQYLGQLDSDAQLELVVWWNWYNATATWDYSDIRVFDTKTNTTEWTKSTNVGMGSEVRVADFTGSGKDSVLQKAFNNFNSLKLFGTGGTPLWTIDSGTYRGWLNRVWNSDSDAGLEHVGDLGSNRVDLVDLTTGTFQGSYYCVTYSPSTSGDLSETYPVDKNPWGGDFVYTTAYNDINGHWSHALMLMSGVDCHLINMYKFDDAWGIYPSFREDIDGDGAKEFVVTTSEPGWPNAYSFTYGTLTAEWTNKTPDDFAKNYGTGWVLGNKNGANRVLDVMTVSTTGVSLFNGLNGTRTTHAVKDSIYYMMKIDQNGDGLDDIVYVTENLTTNKVYAYVMMLDSAVRLKSPLPTVQMDEDTNVSKAVDLQNVFQYSGSWGQLTFGIEHPAGTENVSAAVNGTWLDVWTAVPDWNGNTTITVTATVTGGLGGPVKARIPVRVRPVNDPPRVDPVADVAAVQDKLVNFTVHAWDVEGEPVTFKDNSSLFGINATTGNVSFTPTNDDVGVHFVNVTVSDLSGLNTSVLFKVTVVNVNDPPVITNGPSELAVEDIWFNFTMIALDPDTVLGDTLDWYLDVKENGSLGSKAWLSIETLTGNLSGIPTNSEVGGWDITITAKDNVLATSTLNMTITVMNINDQPVFIDVPQNTTIAIGEEFVFDVNATDIDVGDVLEYSVTSEPASDVMIDTETGLLEFSSDKAKQYLIDVGVTDNNATTHHKFWMTVTTAYLTTLISPSDNAVLNVVNPSLLWSLSPDDMGVTFDIYLSKDRASVENLDPVARVTVGLNGNVWKAMTLEKGTTYHWTIIPVSTLGIGRCASGTWQFKISDIATINYPPVFVTTPSLDAMTGREWNYTPKVSDPDVGDVVEISLASGPSGVVLRAGVLTWTPTEAQLGANNVTLHATDGKDIIEQTFAITVVAGPKNRAPVVDPIGDKSVKAGETLLVPIKATDPDGDILTFTMVDNPAGATISTSGTFSWTPTEGQAGTYVLKVRVSDGSMTTETQFNVTVTKGGGGGGGGASSLSNMMPILLFVLVLVIVAVVVVAFVMMKKKRGKEVQAGPGGGGAGAGGYAPAQGPAPAMPGQYPPPPPPPQPGQGW